MDRTAIEKIIEVSAPNIISENGYTYSDKPLKIIKDPTVETMELSTLSSLVKLIRQEASQFTNPIIVHVTSHMTVSVRSGIATSDRSREIPYNVTAELPKFPFGSRITHEEMMIALKSKFIETNELTDLVQLLGTIVEENNMQIADDGFTQSVTVRKGIALKDNKAVNPIVKLTPYRTFLEVEQPECSFLIRLYDGGYVALHESDGGAWKLKARKNIAEYLKKELADVEGVIVVE